MQNKGLNKISHCILLLFFVMFFSNLAFGASCQNGYLKPGVWKVSNGVLENSEFIVGADGSFTWSKFAISVPMTCTELGKTYSTTYTIDDEINDMDCQGGLTIEQDYSFSQYGSSTNWSVSINGNFDSSSKMSGQLEATVGQGTSISVCSGSTSFQWQADGPVPNISVSPTSHDFGQVGLNKTSPTASFEITNIGGGTDNLELGSLNLTGTDSALFQLGGDCNNNSLAVSGTCNFTVSFTPDSLGDKSAKVEIPSNDNDEPLVSIDLTGQGQPNLKWSFETGWAVGESSPAMGADGTIYVGGNYLDAINQDGSQKWQFKGGITVTSPAIGKDGTIYVASYDNCLYAVKPDGSQKWRTYLSSSRLSPPAIGADGTIYVGNYYLYAVNPDGSVKWSFETSWICSSLAIGADGTIYAGTQDYYLYAINRDGSLKWRFKTGKNVYSSPSISSDGTIYAGSADGHLYAINPDGSQKWRFAAEANVGSSPIIGSDGTIYVGSSDTHLYAINQDGSLKWRFKTGGGVEAAPAIGLDGTIFIGSRDYKFYAIYPDGSQKWSFKTGYELKSSPTIGQDGTIYFGSKDKNLYAISGLSGGPADTDWPMYMHDKMHTGRVGNLEMNNINVLPIMLLLLLNQ